MMEQQTARDLLGLELWVGIEARGASAENTIVYIEQCVDYFLKKAISLLVYEYRIHSMCYVRVLLEVA